MQYNDETFYSQDGQQLPDQGWYECPIFVDRETVAAKLGISIQTVDRMVASGRLPHIKTAPRRSGRVLIPYVALVRLVAEAYENAPLAAPLVPGAISVRFPDEGEGEVLPGGGQIVPGTTPARFPDEG